MQVNAPKSVRVQSGPVRLDAQSTLSTSPAPHIGADNGWNEPSRESAREAHKPMDFDTRVHRSNKPEPLTAPRHYFDENSQCRIIATTPKLSPQRWREFLEGARLSYTRHEVLEALEYPTITSGSTTSLFFAALDSRGKMLGGVRAQGPYTSANQSHANVEWNGFDAELEALQLTIAARIPHGIVELKSAWVDGDAPFGPAITAVIAQSPLFATSLLGVRFGMATAAAHVTKAWIRTGGRIAAEAGAVPYPDDRYLTRLFLWDRTTIEKDADPTAYGQIRFATDALTIAQTDEAVL